MVVAEIPLQLVIFEGPQGSGKTTGANYLANIGFTQYRGIPTGKELAKNTVEQNWRSSKNILLDSVYADHPVVLDRCLWSLVVFLMRRKQDWNNLLYRLGINAFKESIMNSSYTIILLDADPIECYARQLINPGFHSFRSTDEHQAEIELYHDLYTKLAGDGVNTCRISNSSDLPNLYREIRGVIEIA